MLSNHYQKMLIDKINENPEACFTVWLDTMVGTWGLTPKYFEHNGDFYATPFWEGAPGIPVFATDDTGELVIEDFEIYSVCGDPDVDAKKYVEMMNYQVVRLYECTQGGFTYISGAGGT